MCGVVMASSSRGELVEKNVIVKIAMMICQGLNRKYAEQEVL